jgi:hypothetical protein
MQIIDLYKLNLKLRHSIRFILLFPTMNTNRSILLAGAFYIDTLVQLAEYPAENTKVPSLATEERRGGNSANSATVLAQFPNRRVFVVSSVGDIAKSQ